MKRVVLSIFLLQFVSGCFSQDSTGVLDLERVATEMLNPLSGYTTFSGYFDYQELTGTYPGANKQGVTTLNFRPLLSYHLKEANYLVLRPRFPVILSQPVLDENLRFESSGIQFGNIELDALIGNTGETGFVKAIGLRSVFPTATSAAIQRQWKLGPSLVLGTQQEWGLLSFLVYQTWDLSGDVKTSQVGGQYSFAWNFNDAWQFISSPEFSYNWDNESMTLPVGGGPFQTVTVGKTPVKFGVQAYYYVVQDDVLGPKWSFRITVQANTKRS